MACCCQFDLAVIVCLNLFSKFPGLPLVVRPLHARFNTLSSKYIFLISGFHVARLSGYPPRTTSPHTSQMQLSFRPLVGVAASGSQSIYISLPYYSHNHSSLYDVLMENGKCVCIICMVNSRFSNLDLVHRDSGNTNPTSYSTSLSPLCFQPLTFLH